MVDDDQDILTPAKAVMESLGYKVNISFDMDEALNKINEEKPDIIISDVMMRTNYEGFEFAKEITSNPDLKNTPIIITTNGT